MSNESHKWILGLLLLGMLVDTVTPHPMLDARKNEYQYKGMIPQQSVLGFANERQWLFAHRKFRNRCVLEALAAEKKQSGEKVEFASVRLHDGIALADLRAPNNH